MNTTQKKTKLADGSEQWRYVVLGDAARTRFCQSVGRGGVDLDVYDVATCNYAASARFAESCLCSSDFRARWALSPSFAVIDRVLKTVSVRRCGRVVGMSRKVLGFSLPRHFKVHSRSSVEREVLSVSRSDSSAPGVSFCVLSSRSCCYAECVSVLMRGESRWLL